jgi:FKBP-type peptidyl-prolyl cis-trans isomerase
MKLPYIAILITGLLATPVYAEETPATKGDDQKPATAEATKATATTPKSEATASTLATDKDKLSYSLGYNLGKNYKQLEGDLSLEVLTKAIQEGWSGAKPTLPAEEMGQTLKNFQQQLIFKQIAKQKEIADQNLKAGENFLADNKKKEGVVTLPSGLQYKVLTSGTGKSPKATDKVTTNYRGTLTDGTEFDSGQSVSFPVNGVIKGWTEALQLMKEGDKWQLFVPGPLAYGPKGAGEKIKPNATLVFEVELLKVEPATEAPKVEAPAKSEATPAAKEEGKPDEKENDKE